jgi:hypothetical protein
MKVTTLKTVCFLYVLLLISSSFAQNNTDSKQEEFDKKFRFGIKINPQLSWAKSSEKAATGAGSSLAFGFGLMTEFRLSKIIGILTGIGGDFEKYKLSYKADASFNSVLVLDKEDNYVEFKDGMKMDEYNMKDGYSQFVMKSRVIRTTFVTIPLQFKMNTQEYNGIRYFGIFGGDIGLRTKIVSNDEYNSGVKTTITGTTVISGGELSRSNLKVSKDAALLPFRLGLNIGAGIEYRIASSTALYVSLNYFLGFSNLLRGESKYLYKGHEVTYEGATGYDFTPVKQNVTPNAFKLNLGIFF